MPKRKSELHQSHRKTSCDGNKDLKLHESPRKKDSSMYNYFNKKPKFEEKSSTDFSEVDKLLRSTKTHHETSRTECLKEENHKLDSLFQCKQLMVEEDVDKVDKTKDESIISSTSGLSQHSVRLKPDLSVRLKPDLSVRLKPDLVWKQVRGEDLNVDHTMLYSSTEASSLLARCEEEIIYNQGDLAKIQIFGKWINIPRKQAAYGDEGLTYTFSGNTLPAQPWTPLLNEVREHIAHVTGYSYNFVLVNRYKDGSDYMGEHKDDEKDLDPGHPIASLTLGQSRDFVFKHQDCKKGKRKMDTVTVQLRHGMLLMMKHPTNTFWYHSLPKRANALGVRINMTFRKMERSKCKPVPASRNKVL